MAEEKFIKHGSSTQNAIIEGVVAAVDAIKTTLGPSGKCVAITNSFGDPTITRDGATVSKSISFKDPLKNMGAVLVKNASTKTEEKAGDGPQPLDAKILTPNGWTTMGEIKVGDKICGTNGTTQEVTGVFFKGKKELYRVHFANGQVVECCEDHLWTVNPISKRVSGNSITIPLKEIIKTGLYKINSNGDRSFRYYVPKTKVEFSKKELPIDPYLLGLLIGDGCLRKNNSIELSLGYNKKYVLDNIVLPDNIIFNVKDYPDKNYLRVKFSSISKDGPTMHEYINLVGLLDTSSSTKFIPKNYLYSCEEDRVKLFSGLMNTDGYLNNKGLYEYSTTSKQLYENVIELMNGLGMFTRGYFHYRDNDPNSYSNTPIYRISQLKGYKLGTKLIGIEKTGKFVDMQCIKVSNPDELYITNDYIVTHNTSSTGLLIKEMVLKGQKAINTGSNVNEIKSGMLKAEKWVLDYIKANSTPIEDDLEKIRKVATISANNDPEIGNLIVECMEKVGKDSVITAEYSNGLDTTIDITQGLVINRGWSSPQFITSPSDGKCIMENPYIIVIGEKLSSVNQILPLMNQVIPTGRPFLFVVDDIDAVVETTLIMNCLQGNIRTCVVKGIEFGDNRKNTMMDIAVFTGANYICPEYGKEVTQITLEDLGSASKVVVSRENCIIYEGEGDPQEIKERVEILKDNLNDPKCSDYDKTKFTKRIANLSGGIGIIRAGGISEVERANRKATIEDAILASKSALEEGCACGGGYLLYRASLDVQKDKNFWKTLSGEGEREGANIVFSSLPIIMRTVAENSGVSGDIVLEKIKTMKSGIGFNAKTGKYSNLVEDGILDSAKVLRSAIENSISTASMILMIDCTITEDIEEPKEDKK